MHAVRGRAAAGPLTNYDAHLSAVLQESTHAHSAAAGVIMFFDSGTNVAPCLDVLIRTRVGASASILQYIL
jgi:hypothetical protein